MNIITPPIPPAPVDPPANVNGSSDQWVGVRGTSGSGTGVVGQSSSGDGVFGISGSGIAIHGHGNKAGQFDGGVTVNGIISANESLNVKGDVSVGGTINAGGNVVVTGDLTFAGGDCAEDIDAAVDIEPGSVVVVDDGGRLRQCHVDYDKRVVGVVSGAGDAKPAIILGKKPVATAPRAPLALYGRVFCKVDAQYSRIDVGDLLTTSSTPGHAMRASDPTRCFGSVFGKAMGALDSGRGLVPVLIALQ